MTLFRRKPKARGLELRETIQRGVHVMVDQPAFPQGYDPPSASLDPPPVERDAGSLDRVLALINQAPDFGPNWEPICYPAAMIRAAIEGTADRREA